MNIAVLVSGGVDSSVALARLQEQGHTVTAFYLKIWLEDELSYLGDCPWQTDLSYVQQVCDQLNIPLRIVSLQKEYFEHVVSYTIDQVKRGFTPNPDIFCNVRIKFGMFCDYLNRQPETYDKIASGHYAQVIESNGLFELHCAPDLVKDQTYFLSYLSQKQLSQLLFPIGHLSKAQVRAYAEQYDLPNKGRKDSQGICFLGKLKFSDFIKHYLGTQEGDLVEYETGKKWGTHNGFWYYTIGQRQGIGLADGPWYVVEKHPQDNVVMISRNYFTIDKKRSSCVITDCNWISGHVVQDKKKLSVKLRHGAQLYNATICHQDNNRVQINLDRNDQGIAPGQFAVLYDNGVCLGSGIITNTE